MRNLSSGIRLITILADDASTGTHQVCICPTVRWPEHHPRVSCPLPGSATGTGLRSHRTLLRMTHDIPERNWKRYTRDPGTVEGPPLPQEPLMNRSRSRRKASESGSAKSSSLGDAIIAAINSMQTPAAESDRPPGRSAQPPSGTAISMPVVMDRIIVSPRREPGSVSTSSRLLRRGALQVHPEPADLPAHIPPPGPGATVLSGISRTGPRSRVRSV